MGVLVVLYLADKFRAMLLQFGNNGFNIFNGKGNMPDTHVIYSMDLHI